MRSRSVPEFCQKIKGEAREDCNDDSDDRKHRNPCRYEQNLSVIAKSENEMSKRCSQFLDLEIANVQIQQKPN